jgi:hypothetical protein
MKENLIFELSSKFVLLVERHVSHMLLGMNDYPVELVIT